MAELDARRAEVLGNAARRIQRQSRTFIACKEFRALRGAAIVLQSNCRGILFRNLLQNFDLLLCCYCCSCPAYWIQNFLASVCKHEISGLLWSVVSYFHADVKYISGLYYFWSWASQTFLLHARQIGMQPLWGNATPGSSGEDSEDFQKTYCQRILFKN